MNHIFINGLSVIRDGGSIAIECNGKYSDLKFTLITIDFSIKSKTKGQWFFGEVENGTILDDKEFKNLVIRKIEEHIKYEENILNNIKESIL